MQVFKGITTRQANNYIPFEVTTIRENDKTYAIVEPKSVIYRSFNLKDMMIWSGFLDNNTRSLIQSTEGNINGHTINNLGVKLELQASKNNHIIYLRVGVGPNLYATGAEILVSDISNPWSGYPEPFEYVPGLEFDGQGNLKGSVVYRRQTAAIFPIAYLTQDTSQNGKAILVGKDQNYKLIQVIDYNIMMTTFNYDGNPVSYGIPFMNPFFYYSSSSTS